MHELLLLALDDHTGQLCTAFKEIGRDSEDTVPGDTCALFCNIACSIITCSGIENGREFEKPFYAYIQTP